MKSYYLQLLFLNLIHILWFRIGNVEGILGGKVAVKENYKYHVSLQINNKIACGAAALRANYVVTAGQCILDLSGKFLNVDIFALAGIKNLDDTDKVSRRVIKAFVPYDFRPTKKFSKKGASSSSKASSSTSSNSRNELETGDIAVLKLEEAFPITPVIQCLDRPLAQLIGGGYYQYFRKTAVLTGFGTDIPTAYKSASDLSNLDSRQHPNKILKSTFVHVEKQATCQSAYERSTDSHLCATSYQTVEPQGGACHGDIGGPIVFNTVLIGVLSKYTDRCNESSKPSLYTKVSSFLPFLESSLNDQQTSDIRVADYDRSTNVLEIIHPSRRQNII